MEKIKYSLFSLRDLLLASGPMLLGFILICGLAYWWVDPAPDRVIDMSTGPEQGSYTRFAKAYAAELAKNQVNLRIQTSQGSQQNLQRISDPDSVVELGFVRSGSTDPATAAEQGLMSLGGLFYEPIWIFYRSKQTYTSLRDLRGKQISLGAEGSGLHRIFSQMLALNGLQDSDVNLSRDQDEQAMQDFLNGKLDVLVLSTASDSPVVQQLLQTKGVQLFDFVQAEAYTRRLPYLSQITLPRGIIDIGADLPARDYHLLSTTVTLVAHESLHPALVSLMLQAVQKVHSRADWFSDQNEFPSERYSEIPVSHDAEKYYKNGPPVLQRYLPFWIANFIERMWLVVVALGALLLPLSKVIPPLYVWRIRSRIYRWYGELRDIEQSLDGSAGETQAGSLQQSMQRLDQIEQTVNGIEVPLSYAEELYGLRSHIDLVRKRIASQVVLAAQPD